AEEIAGHLGPLCEPGALVGICVERSTEMVAALLAVWKAGATYLPLDPSHPQQRLQFILENSGARVLLTEQAFAGLFPGIEIPLLRLEDTRTPLRSEPRMARPDPDELAYVLYTSGSSGKPKGVPIRHKSLANLLHSMRTILRFTSEDRILA